MLVSIPHKTLCLRTQLEEHQWGILDTYFASIKWLLPGKGLKALLQMVESTLAVWNFS
jgi:hypothetical protein